METNVRPSLPPSYPHFTADVMTNIGQRCYKSKQNNISPIFTMIGESKLDEMTDFSSETEVCTWEK